MTRSHFLFANDKVIFYEYAKRGLLYWAKISRSTCEGFCVSKVSYPAFITPFRQVISILGSGPKKV